MACKIYKSWRGMAALEPVIITPYVGAAGTLSLADPCKAYMRQVILTDQGTGSTGSPTLGERAESAAQVISDTVITTKVKTALMADPDVKKL